MMKRFIVNKYPIRFFDSGLKQDRLIEIGTVFTISAMSFNAFEIAALIEIDGLDVPLMFDSLMLEKGFNDQDYAGPNDGDN